MRIHSRYFSLHSFRELKTKQLEDEIKTSFSVFHNNVISLKRNLENLQTHLLHELDFHLNIIGVYFKIEEETCKQKSVYDHLLHHTVTLQAFILCLWYYWSSATDFVIFPILCLTFPVETVRITQASNKPMVQTLCTEAVSVGIYQLRPVK